MKIIPTGTSIEVKTVDVVIFAPPGVGKTTFAQTADEPLTIDFDNGSYRSEFRKDVVLPESWKEINSGIFEALQDYKTVVIDTVDNMLELIGENIIKIDYNMSKPKYKRQFYGRLKDEFSKFAKKLRSTNVNRIWICHVKETEEGEFKMKTPKIAGGSYDILVNKADFVGYLYNNGDLRELQFAPSESQIGKDSADLGIIPVPNFHREPKFAAELLQRMLTALNSFSDEQAKAQEYIQEQKRIIVDFKSAKEYNAYILQAKQHKENKGLKLQVFNFMKSYAAEQDIVYDQETGKFISVEAGLEEEAKKAEPESKEKPKKKSSSKKQVKAEENKSEVPTLRL